MKEIFLRRSVREFNAEPVAKELLLKLVEAGFAAPSARNQASRAFVIIDEKEVLAKLSTASPGAGVLGRAQAAIAVLGVNPAEITTPQMQQQDLSAATENILLEATSLGIGSCWIGIYPHEDRMEIVGKTLEVKDRLFPFALIALGYPKEEKAFYDRQKTDKTKIYWNRVK